VVLPEKLIVPVSNSFELVEKKRIAESRDQGGFVQQVDPEVWQNRTIYCSDESVVKQVMDFMEGV